MLKSLFLAVLSLGVIFHLTAHSDILAHDEANAALVGAYAPERLTIELMQDPDSNHNRMIIFLRNQERCTVFVHPHMSREQIRRTVSCLPAH